MSADEQNRELTRSIRREVGKLSEQWNNLIDRSDNWKHRLDEYMTVSFNFTKKILFVQYIYVYGYDNGLVLDKSSIQIYHYFPNSLWRIRALFFIFVLSSLTGFALFKSR